MLVHWGAAAYTDKASLARLPLTSHCVARFLTDHRLVGTTAQGLETPDTDEP